MSSHDRGTLIVILAAYALLALIAILAFASLEPDTPPGDIKLAQQRQGWQQGHCPRCVRGARQ